MINTYIENEISDRLRQRQLPEQTINFFLSARRRLKQDPEVIDWKQLEAMPPEMVCYLPKPETTAAKQLQQLGEMHLGNTVIIKLNGGRSTTMGGLQPKCTLEAKDGKSFLDIALAQLAAANDQRSTEVPLVLMNSFFTEQASVTGLGKTPLLVMDFVQQEYPRLRRDNLQPLDTGSDDDWCPAGHGDLYMSLAGSGLLNSLLELGLRYAFVSNIDNLAATLCPVLLGKMVHGGYDFMMEVTRKTAEDVKGGAPVLYRGKPALLEIAQVPPEHLDEFKDIKTFSYFNTNNLWLDLLAIKNQLENGALELPLIRNNKTIRGVEVVQIETAMGAGLQCFDRPGVIAVPRSRFVPVKTEKDLQLLRSDAFWLDEEYHVHAR